MNNKNVRTFVKIYINYIEFLSILNLTELYLKQKITVNDLISSLVYEKHYFV